METRPSARVWLAALAEACAALSLLAWVGGHAALGAFAARIVFRDLPRALAAPTMTTIFRSFDGVIAVSVGVLAAATLGRLWIVGARGLDRLVAVVGGCLCALGLFELTYVHPRIEALFRAGRTLEPEFARLHRLSERCGHLEVLLAAALLIGHALARRVPRPDD
jgi:hypothetical protein